MLRMRRSRTGSVLAGGFLALAAGLQGWLLVSAAINPADSGEGGLLLLLFSAPWSLIVPNMLLEAGWFDALAPLVLWLMIGLNALLLYCLAGGVRFERRSGRS